MTVLAVLGRVSSVLGGLEHGRIRCSGNAGDHMREDDRGRNDENEAIHGLSLPVQHLWISIIHGWARRMDWKHEIMSGISLPLKRGHGCLPPPGAGGDSTAWFQRAATTPDGVSIARARVRSLAGLPRSP